MRARWPVGERSGGALISTVLPCPVTMTAPRLRCSSRRYAARRWKWRSRGVVSTLRRSIPLRGLARSLKGELSCRPQLARMSVPAFRSRFHSSCRPSPDVTCALIHLSRGLELSTARRELIATLKAQPGKKTQRDPASARPSACSARIRPESGSQYAFPPHAQGEGPNERRGSHSNETRK